MLMEQLADLRAQQARDEEAVTALEAEQQKLAVLEQQAKLLELIAEHGLDANDTLTRLRLGPDADPLLLVRAMARALQVLNVGAMKRLQLQGFQYGGQFSIPGVGASDSVPVQFLATPGETVTVTPRGMLPPPDPRTIAAGRAALQGNTFNMSLAPHIYSRMDEAEFAVRVEQAVRRALQG